MVREFKGVVRVDAAVVFDCVVFRTDEEANVERSCEGVTRGAVGGFLSVGVVASGVSPTRVLAHGLPFAFVGRNFRGDFFEEDRLDGVNEGGALIVRYPYVSLAG